MQNPLERPQAQTSVVGACTVTDCKFNEHHECHAGQIEVRVSGSGAELEGPKYLSNSVFH